MNSTPLQRIVRWYCCTVYGRWEGPGVLPFYCDPKKVGLLAVGEAELRAGRPAAIFKLTVLLGMYQARRDRLIQAQQRGLSKAEVALLTSPGKLALLVTTSDCPALRQVETFETACRPWKCKGQVTCNHPEVRGCPVREAGTILRRTGVLGKLPTSAWLQLYHRRRWSTVLKEILEQETDPCRRAQLLVTYFEQLAGLGPKVSTLLVSALSTPALAPGLAPLWPDFDGHDLVVLDTHANRLLDLLRPKGSPRTARAREQWLRLQAKEIDLRCYHPNLPQYSPRLVQQALYWFGSRSNRLAHGDPCAQEPEKACSACVPTFCPFGLNPKKRLS